MDAVAALKRLGNVSDRASLMSLSTRGSLQRALDAGEIVRRSKNLYVLPGAERAEVASRRVRGVVSHLSAATAWGWKVKVLPTRPVVTVARNRHPGRLPDIDIRYAEVTEAELRVGRTSRVRTAVDCARTLPFDEALAVIDSALRSGSVNREELAAAATVGPRSGRASALRVIASADGRAANPFESVMRAVAVGVEGLEVRPQGVVGPRWHADLTDSRLMIAIEGESFEFHALPEAFRHDIRRYTDMTRRGWLVARFLWEDVMARPDYVHQVLADLVSLRHQEALRQPAG